MNLTTPSTQNAKGMTMLEVTVLIMVLLSLVAILFVGARAWKSGSDRSSCIINIRNAQIAVRGYQDTHALPAGTSIDMVKDLIGAGKFLDRDPECPSGGTYDHISHIPLPGELALTCSFGATMKHVPAYTSDW